LGSSSFLTRAPVPVGENKLGVCICVLWEMWVSGGLLLVHPHPRSAMVSQPLPPHHWLRFEAHSLAAALLRDRAADPPLSPGLVRALTPPPPPERTPPMQPGRPSSAAPTTAAPPSSSTPATAVDPLTATELLLAHCRLGLAAAADAYGTPHPRLALCLRCHETPQSSSFVQHLFPTIFFNHHSDYFSG
jgi:hypothetical protein